jgi:hypothetical protein
MGIIPEVSGLEVVDNRFSKLIKKPKVSVNNSFKLPIYSSITNAFTPGPINHQYNKGRRVFRNMESYLLTEEPYKRDSISQQYIKI